MAGSGNRDRGRRRCLAAAVVITAVTSAESAFSVTDNEAGSKMYDHPVVHEIASSSSPAQQRRLRLMRMNAAEYVYDGVDVPAITFFLLGFQLPNTYGRCS